MLWLLILTIVSFGCNVNNITEFISALNNVSCNQINLLDDISFDNHYILNNVRHKIILGNDKALTGRYALRLDYSYNITFSNLNILTSLNLTNSYLINFTNVKINNSYLYLYYTDDLIFKDSKLTNLSLTYNNGQNIAFDNTTILFTDIRMNRIEEMNINNSIIVAYISIDFSEFINIENSMFTNGTVELYKLVQFELINSTFLNNNLKIDNGRNYAIMDCLFSNNSQFRLTQTDNLEDVSVLNCRFENGEISIYNGRSPTIYVNFENVSLYNISFKSYQGGNGREIELNWNKGKIYNTELKTEDTDLYLTNISISSSNLEIKYGSSLYLNSSIVNNSYIYLFRSDLNMEHNMINFSNISTEEYSVETYNNTYFSSNFNLTKNYFNISNDLFINNSNLTLEEQSSGEISSSIFQLSKIYVNTDYRLLFYNNIFNTSSDPIIITSSPSLSLNTHLTQGTSIIGTQYIGGNYWAKPDGTGYSETCNDLDQNNICDVPYQYNGHYDYYPLTNNTQFTFCDVSTENELRAAVNNNSCNTIRMLNNIGLSSNLTLNRSLFLYGNNKILTGNLNLINPNIITFYDITVRGNMSSNNLQEIKVMYSKIESNIFVFNSTLLIYLSYLNSNVTSNMAVIGIGLSNLTGRIFSNTSYVVSFNSEFIDSNINLFESTFISNISNFRNSNLSIFQSVFNTSNDVFNRSLIYYENTIGQVLEKAYFINSLLLFNSSSIKISKNVLYNTSIMANNSMVKVYNNIINASQYNIEGDSILLNSPLIMGVSILDTQYIGGNYWAKPDGTGYSETCNDVDQNNICDSPYQVSSLIDQYPLTLTNLPNVCNVSNQVELINAFNNNNCNIIRLINDIQIMNNNLYIENFSNKVLDGNGYQITRRFVTYIFFRNFSYFSIINAEFDTYSITAFIANGTNFGVLDSTIEMTISNVTNSYMDGMYYKGSVFGWPTINIENCSNMLITNNKIYQLKIRRQNNNITILDNKIASITLENTNNTPNVMINRINTIIFLQVNSVNNNIKYNLIEYGLSLVYSEVNLSENMFVYGGIYLDYSNLSLTNSEFYNDLFAYIDFNSSAVLNNNKIRLNRGQIWVYRGSKLWLFNNIINISGNITLDIQNSVLLLNTSRQPGPSIINTPYIGGNYWTTPNMDGYSDTCSDNDNDNICDAPYNINGSIDYYPLTFGGIVDNQAPNVNIIAPINNSVHSVGNVNFRFNVTDNLANVLTCSYNISGNSSYYNTVSVQNGTIYSVAHQLSTGNYNFTVECTDGVNNKSSRIVFYVVQGGSGQSGGSSSNNGGSSNNASSNITQNVSNNVTQNQSINQNVTQNTTNQNISQNITNITQNIPQTGFNQSNITLPSTNITLPNNNITLPNNTEKEKPKIIEQETKQTDYEQKIEDTEKEVKQIEQYNKDRNIGSYWWLILLIAILVIAVILILRKMKK